MVNVDDKARVGVFAMVGGVVRSGLVIFVKLV